MGAEEDLNETLIDPESLDNPNPLYEKGEQQPSKFRDAWAAILFYAQFIAVICVCGIYGVPAVQRNVAVDGGVADYTGLIYITLIASASSFILSGISLALMSACPKLLIQFSLLFALLIALLITSTSFYYGLYISGGVGLFCFLLSCCYACLVWKRIPFAAANLNTGLTALRRNAGVFLTVVIITVVSFGYVVAWMVAMIGVCDATATNDVSGGQQQQLPWGYLVLLLLALFWTQQVFQNTIHVIVAGVVATWWFKPDEASSCCSVAIKDSFVRATTFSFGSVCFGSLLVAIIQLLRSLVESARQDSREEGALFVLCLVDCILQCMEGILEYFNKFAYIYVGMYGYGFLDAGKKVMTLFAAKGWSVIINDKLVSNTLALFCLVDALLVGWVGIASNAVFPSWLAGFEEAASGVAFGISFLVGLVISSVILTVVDSSVNTVVVGFAEAPEELEQNHPQLSDEMRAAWRAVYPAYCGF